MDIKIRKYLMSIIISLFITIGIGYIFYGIKIFFLSESVSQITVNALSGIIFYFTIKYFKAGYAFLPVILLILMNLIFFKNWNPFVITGLILFYFVSVLSVLLFLKISQSKVVRDSEWAFILNPLVMMLLFMIFSVITLSIQYLIVYFFSVEKFSYSIKNLYIALRIGIVNSGISGFGIGLGIVVSKKILEELKEKLF